MENGGNYRQLTKLSTNKILKSVEGKFPLSQISISYMQAQLEKRNPIGVRATKFRMAV